jgi:CBS domain-containing protein
MNPLIDVQILRVFLGETAQRDGKLLYEHIVEEARKRGMAGACVTRGTMGFGAKSLLRTAKILRLSEDMPITVEIVDTPDRIADFLPIVDSMVDEGTLVVEQARAIFHLPLRIRDIMSADVVSVGPDASLPAIVELLLHRRVKALPVLDGARIAGIITGGDLLRRARMPLRLDVQCQLPQNLRNEHVNCLEFEGLTAKDIMTSPVRSLNIKTRVADALEMMAREELKRLPVVDDSGNLMGIVSRLDVLRAIGRASAVTERLPSLPAGIRRTARDVMFKEVPTAGPDASMKELLDKMLGSPLRRVVIVDEDNTVLGIVLDRDLVTLFSQRSKPGLLHTLVATLSGKPAVHEDMTDVARDVMQTVVRGVRPDTPLADVVRSLVENKIKRLVVTDDQGRLHGMVDRDAVLRGLAGY